MDFNFLFTNDGSTGLYNKSVDDIYHSVFGAKSEAEEKFVEPLEFSKNYFNKDSLKVLDICYGIGYNTKAFLKKIIQTKYKGKISIDILEYNVNLALISPFIKDGYFYSNPEISYILCSALMEQIYQNKDNLKELIESQDNKKYFTPFYRDLIKKYKNLGYSYNPNKQINSFLHNIYYHCISTRHKKHLNSLKFRDFSINTYFDDARKTVKSLKGSYDIMFLDAFTPSKVPTLWSLDFFRELYRLASDDCMLVTYSNSAAVRHALCDAGFYAGKLFDKNKRHCGTNASKNNRLIKNMLDDFDIGLMNTNAGIYYRDKNLCRSSEEILAEHEHRKTNLNLESSSHYIKTHKKENSNALAK